MAGVTTLHARHHSISLVITVGSERFQDVPRLIIQPDIVRRIQKDNYVQMDAFKLPDAREFVKGVLGQWIDPARRAALEQSERFSLTTPDYDPQYYPFTAGGFANTAYLRLSIRARRSRARLSPSSTISRPRHISRTAA